MDNPAILDDLRDRWYPNPLDDSAAADVAETILDDAWDALQDEAPGVDARLTAGSISTSSVIRAIVYAAKRVLENPENYTDGSVSIDDFAESWKRDAASVSNDLYFTAAELRRVGATPVGAFTITPGRSASDRSYDWC